MSGFVIKKWVADMAVRGLMDSDGDGHRRVKSCFLNYYYYYIYSTTCFPNQLAFVTLTCLNNNNNYLYLYIFISSGFFYLCIYKHVFMLRLFSEHCQ